MTFQMNKVDDFVSNFEQKEFHARTFLRRRNHPMSFLFYAPLLEISFPLNHYFPSCEIKGGFFRFKTKLTKGKTNLSFPYSFILNKQIFTGKSIPTDLEEFLVENDYYKTGLNYEFTENPSFHSITKEDDFDAYLFSIPEKWKEDVQKLQNFNFKETSSEYQELIYNQVKKSILLNELVQDYNLLLERRRTFSHKEEEIMEELLSIQKLAFETVGVEEEFIPKELLAPAKKVTVDYEHNETLQYKYSYIKNGAYISVDSNNPGYSFSHHDYTITAAPTNFEYEIRRPQERTPERQTPLFELDWPGEDIPF